MITGRPTPFHEIHQLKHLATTHSNNEERRPNVTWGRDMEEDVLNVEGLRVPWSGWHKLYAKLIERIKDDLEFVTFSTRPSLPPRAAYIENIRDDRPGVNFAKTLPEEYQRYDRYLLEHVLSQAELRDRYVLPGPGRDVRWNQEAARGWMDQVDKLNKSLCVLGFLSSGPGMRGEEWASMLAMNEQNGSRSVFWTMKGLCFMQGYSKVIWSILHAHCLADLPLLDKSHNSS